MLKNLFNQLKFYLLDHPELEARLPESYVDALKAYDIDNVLTIKPVIMSLFSEARINEEASLEFIDRERYPEQPNFFPLSYQLITDNNIFQMLNICYGYFPEQFEDYIVAIVDHPFLENIIADAYEEEFSGEDGLERWDAFIDAERPMKLKNCLSLVFQEFCALLASNESVDSIYDSLTPETRESFNQYFQEKDQVLFLTTLDNLQSIHFFTPNNIVLFSNFIQNVDIYVYEDLNDFFSFPELNTSNQLLIRAFQVILNHPQHLREVINILMHFVMFGVFSGNLLDSIEYRPHLDTISEIFNALSTTGIMTPENCEALFYQFLPMVGRIAASDALNVFIIGIANEQEFTEEDWQTLLQLIEMNATEQQMQNFVDGIFNPAHEAEMIDLDVEENAGQLVLNDQQSTHNHSVHKSASKTAIRLKKHYSIENASLILSEIKNYFDSLGTGNWKDMASYRAFNSISIDNYFYFDAKSNTTLKELLLLTWVAIHDDTHRIGEVEDALTLWLKGLYTIQRGKNEADMQSLPDAPICFSGGFNQLANCITGAHSLFELRFITFNSFTLKFEATIQTLMHQYIGLFSNPHNLIELYHFNQMIKNLELNGIAEYWPLMKDYLTIILFDEFKFLFETIDNPNFLEAIEAGGESEVRKLYQHQKTVGESRGYQQYLNNSLFAWPRNAKNQHEFDKQHGLVIYKAP
jgi:hypothetical protein